MQQGMNSTSLYNVPCCVLLPMAERFAGCRLDFVLIEIDVSSELLLFGQSLHSKFFFFFPCNKSKVNVL